MGQACKPDLIWHRRRRVVPPPTLLPLRRRVVAPIPRSSSFFGASERPPPVVFIPRRWCRCYQVYAYALGFHLKYAKLGDTRILLLHNSFKGTGDMASSPPVSSSKIGDSITAIGAINGNATSQRPSAYGMPKPSLRGQNKPKCIKCGNVARSRCPFQSCKSCCAKAENPCHIHVLKQNGTLPDKPPTPSSTSVEQPPNDVSSPSGSSWRLNSLRHASTNFVNILRAKKPLTKKDAINLNKWKFMKLREHLEGNVEAENEAFDRYVQNVSLLEETFSLPVMEEAEPQNQVSLGSIPSEKLISEIKTKLKSDSQRTDSLRERIKSLIDQKLLELLNGELGFDDYDTYDDDPDDVKEFKRSKMIMQSRYDKNASMADLISKLNRAANKEDMTACSDLMLQHRSNNLSGYQFTENKAALYFRSLPKMCSTVHVDQDALENINSEFSSLDHIFQL